MPGSQPIGSLTNFPQGFANGLTLRNIPLLQAQPGSVYWLDNNGSLNKDQHAGSDSNRGSFRDPLASLSQAFTVCQGGRGDIIMVAPGHAETISSATALRLSTSDVAVIGLGGGSSRPQFTLDTATTATINTTGNNISFQNCQFVANFAGIASLFTMANAQVVGSISTAGILTVTSVSSGTLYQGNALIGTGMVVPNVILFQITGTTGGAGTYQMSNSPATAVASTTLTTQTQGFALDACEIRDTSSALNFLVPITTSTISNAADQLSITRSNIFLKATSGVVNLATPLGTNDRWTIQGNNYVSATTGTGAAILPIAAGKVLTNLLLDSNVINIKQAQTLATGILVTTNGTTNSGMISRNLIQSLDDTTEILATASSGFIFSQNYYAGVADKSGYLLPAADS